eukprot:scaffold9029_cov69-Phaeocystis_antarctica.AAC.2
MSLVSEVDVRTATFRNPEDTKAILDELEQGVWASLRASHRLTARGEAAVRGGAANEQGNTGRPPPGDSGLDWQPG